MALAECMSSNRKVSLSRRASPLKPEPYKSSMRRNDLSFSDIFGFQGSVGDLQRLEEHSERGPPSVHASACYGRTPIGVQSSGFVFASLSGDLPTTGRRDCWAPPFTAQCAPVAILSSEEDTSDEHELDTLMDELHAA